MERFLTTYVLFEWFRSAYYTSHLDAVWAPSSVVLCRTRYRGPHFSLTARQPAAPRCSLGTAWTLADIPVEEVPRAYRSARSPLKNLWNSVEKKKKRKKKKKVTWLPDALLHKHRFSWIDVQLQTFGSCYLLKPNRLTLHHWTLYFHSGSSVGFGVNLIDSRNQATPSLYLWMNPMRF